VSNPANAAAAGRQARALLARSLPGSRRGTVAAHLTRAERVADLIWRRWQVGPYRWRVKHLRWYLTTQARRYSTSTRYRYWLTVRVLVQSLEQDEDWLARLRGPWVRPTAEGGPLRIGRPPS